MAAETEGKKKSGKTVGKLALDEIVDGAKKQVADDEGTGWGDAPDIPDLPRSA